MKKQVEIIVNGKAELVDTGTLLSDILDIDKPCGGRGNCGKCKVKVNGNEKLACRYLIDSNIEVETFESFEISSEIGAKKSGHLTDNLCFALDIGTTTLALALVSIDEKQIVEVVTATNPQRVFGADIMTRIDYCQKNSVTALHDKLIDEINNMMSKIGKTAEIMYVSANVTMLHTFFGEDCSSIGIAPYSPVFLESRQENADKIGVIGVDKVISIPSISSFIGADIVSGLYFVGMPQNNKYNLLVDLGTNAEIVLYSNKEGLATAAAAGPCFEGANISCGMSATKGAIFSYKLNECGDSYQTIDNYKPLGICGTGLIDIIAELVRNEIIDETGYMEDDYFLCDNVYLSRKDVSQYQLAKSAVYSAILSLMKTGNVTFDNIEKMYISGGFSAKINIANAVKSGLFPKELAGKAVVINNSSLQGNVKWACEKGDLEQFINDIKYVDLSSNSYFSELFIENMIFQ